MQKISNPVPLFLSARGTLLDGGRIWIGVANADPEEQPVTVYYDRALTIAAAQPLRTIGGQIVNENLSPAFIFIAADNYSIRIRDADGSVVNFVAAALDQQTPSQPMDDDLTAIAAVGTTSFGRALLALADAEAARGTFQIPDALPRSGGTLTGDVTRQGAGAIPYLGQNYPTSRIFAGPLSAGDPSGVPGDFWFYWQ